MAKLGILEALINVHLTWLAVVAIIFAIIGAYYYLRVVKEVMYFEKPEAESSLTLAKQGRFVLTLNGIMVLLLGIMRNFIYAVPFYLFLRLNYAYVNEEKIARTMLLRSLSMLVM